MHTDDQQRSLVEGITQATNEISSRYEDGAPSCDHNNTNVDYLYQITKVLLDDQKAVSGMHQSVSNMKDCDREGSIVHELWRRLSKLAYRIDCDVKANKEKYWDW